MLISIFEEVVTKEFIDIRLTKHESEILIKALGLIDERKTDRDMDFVIEELKTKIRAALREIKQ